MARWPDWTSHELIGEFGTQSPGTLSLSGPNKQFPVLIKYLDAAQDLSVQVHPDRAYAAAHPEAHLKCEAWYIVQNDPGSRLLKGLKRGVTKESFSRAIANGKVESLIEAIPVKVGECFYLPSGTVHALGAESWRRKFRRPATRRFAFLISIASTRRPASRESFTSSRPCSALILPLLRRRQRRRGAWPANFLARAETAERPAKAGRKKLAGRVDGAGRIRTACGGRGGHHRAQPWGDGSASRLSEKPDSANRRTDRIAGSDVPWLQIGLGLSKTTMGLVLNCPNQRQWD